MASQQLLASDPKFQLGDRVKVFAEKTFTKNKGQFFEAIGDVVIISDQNTLYGEAASLDLEKGYFSLTGNVRFVSEEMTMWGSRLEYDFKKKTVKMDNVRMETTEFSVVASHVEKLNDTDYVAMDAEFTTCKDCTESWSLYGNKLKMTIGEYVVVKHGLIRIKGVEVFYLPYIVFPIKDKRQSGVLFPQLASRVSEGVSLGIPYFWAIDQDKDLTITPTFWAKRGYGGEVEYRQAFSDKSWLQMSGRFIKDRLYQSGTHDDWRSYGEIESRIKLTDNLSFLGHWSEAHDLDFLSDFSYYTDHKILGSDLGGEGVLEYRGSWGSISLEAHKKRNLLVDDPYEFDQSYVQVLPQVTLEATPYYLWQKQRRFLPAARLGGFASFNQFKQGRFDESQNIRNTHRLSLKPYIDTDLWVGNYLKLKNRYTWDSQFYSFENNQKSFKKYAGVMTTELSWGVSKKFGQAYKERRLIEDVIVKKKIQKNQETIGILPRWDNQYFSEDELISHSSYRHIQNFKIKHYYLAGQSEKGNGRFLQQISRSEGWFDYDDALREEEYLLGKNDTRTQLSPKNTLELQWNHLLYQNSPIDDLGEKQAVSRIGFLNISQGVNLAKNSADTSQKLERLAVNLGASLNGWSVGASEYYFYTSGDHLLNFSLSKVGTYFDLRGSYHYNSLGSQTYAIGSRFRPFSFLHFGYYNQFDFNAKRSVRSIVEVDFLPRNNCWKLGVSFQKTLVAKRFAFNFVFNFGDGNFHKSKRSF